MLPIPFSVIGGFLGAGKTSLTNRLLVSARDKRFAVLVNDFGALNIDESLINAFDGKLMQLANGCICCSLSSGLVDAMLMLMQQAEQIDHILIEASGVSNPSRIMDFARIDPDLQPNMTLVLIDCLHFLEHLADQRLSETIKDQIFSADVFLLSKTQQAGLKQVEMVREELARFHAKTPVLSDTDDPVEVLFGEMEIKQQPVLMSRRDHGLLSIAFTSKHPIDIQQMRPIMQREKQRIVRAKGQINAIDGSYVYQQVGEQIALQQTQLLPLSSLVVIGPEVLDDVSLQLQELGWMPVAIP